MQQQQVGSHQDQRVKPTAALKSNRIDISNGLSKNAMRNLNFTEGSDTLLPAAVMPVRPCIYDLFMCVRLFFAGCLYACIVVELL